MNQGVDFVGTGLKSGDLVLLRRYLLLPLRSGPRIDRILLRARMSGDLDDLDCRVLRIFAFAVGPRFQVITET
jgi:hypothetical protein